MLVAGFLLPAANTLTMQTSELTLSVDVASNRWLAPSSASADVSGMVLSGSSGSRSLCALSTPFSMTSWHFGSLTFSHSSASWGEHGEQSGEVSSISMASMRPVESWEWSASRASSIKWAPTSESLFSFTPPQVSIVSSAWSASFLSTGGGSRGDSGEDETAPPAFRVEVDTTIVNESVSTFSDLKQLNLRLGLALLLNVTSSSVAIMSITDVGDTGVQQRAERALADAASINVLSAIEFSADRSVKDVVAALIAVFADGSLAAYMELLGTPMTLVLNNVDVQRLAPMDDDWDGTGGGDDAGDGDDGLLLGSESDPEGGKRTPPSTIIVATTGGFFGLAFIVVVVAKQHMLKRGLFMRFTRVVPAARM